MVDLNAAGGVNFNGMDHFARVIQAASLETTHNAEELGWEDLTWTRGESTHVMHNPDLNLFVGHTNEGLGTKNLVLSSLVEQGILTPEQVLPYIANFAVCAGAMIINDLITLGVMPVDVAQHLDLDAAASWLQNPGFGEALVEGWLRMCQQAKCVAGGGETAGLGDLVVDDRLIVSGSAWGVVPSGYELLNPADIEPGDELVGLPSLGIHANGLSAARKVGLMRGYDLRLDSGRPFYDALMQPTVVYRNAVRACMGEGLVYGINITGHGWRKIMRADQPLVYNVYSYPELAPEFMHIASTLGWTIEELYATLNCGLGFVLVAKKGKGDRLIGLCQQAGYNAWRLGEVAASDDGKRRVHIAPLDITYEQDTLQVR